MARNPDDIFAPFRVDGSSPSSPPQTPSESRPSDDVFAPYRVDPGPMPDIRRVDNTLGDEFRAGLGAGIDSMQGSLYGLGGLVGRELGIEWLENAGNEGAEEQFGEAAAATRQSAGFTDIDSAGGFFRWAAASFGEAIPSLAAAGTGAGLGAVGAKKAVELGVKRSVARRVERDLMAKGFTKGEALESTLDLMRTEQGQKMIADAFVRGSRVIEPATRVAIGRGQTAGAVAVSALPQIGAIDQELVSAGIAEPGLTALVGGIAGGALEAIPALRLMDKMFPGVERQVSKQFVKDFAVATGTQAALEGSTEAAQEMIQLASLAYHDPTFDMFSPDARKRVVDAFAAGALVGAVTGGPAEAIGNIQPAAKAAKAQLPEFRFEAQRGVHEIAEEEGGQADFRPAENTIFEEIRDRAYSTVAPAINSAVNSMRNQMQSVVDQVDSVMAGGNNVETAKFSQLIGKVHNDFVEEHKQQFADARRYVEEQSRRISEVAETISDPEQREKYVGDALKSIQSQLSGFVERLRRSAAKRDRDAEAEVDNMDIDPNDFTEVVDTTTPEVGEVDAPPALRFGKFNRTPTVQVSGREDFQGFDTREQAEQALGNIKKRFRNATDEDFDIVERDDGSLEIVSQNPDLRDDQRFWEDLRVIRDSAGRHRVQERKAGVQSDGSRFGFKFKRLDLDLMTMAFRGKNYDPNADSFDDGFRAFVSEMLDREVISPRQAEGMSQKFDRIPRVVKERAEQQLEQDPDVNEFGGNPVLSEGGDLADVRGDTAGTARVRTSEDRASDRPGAKVLDDTTPQEDDRVTAPENQPSEFESRQREFDPALGKVGRRKRDNAREVSDHDKRILRTIARQAKVKVLLGFDMAKDGQMSKGLKDLATYVQKTLGLANDIVIMDETGLKHLIDSGAVSDPAFDSVLAGGKPANIRIGDKSYVYLPTKILSNPELTSLALGHELGHHLYSVAFDNLTFEGQKRLKRASGAKSEAEFNEWMADQLGAWITQRQAPKNKVEAFFAKVGGQIRRLFEFINGHDRFQLDETFAEFADAVALRAKQAESPGASPLNDQAMREWFKNEGVTMYKWWGKLPQKENMEVPQPRTDGARQMLDRITNRYPQVAKRAIVMRNWINNAYKVAVAPSTSVMRTIGKNVKAANELVRIFNRQDAGSEKQSQNYHQRVNLMKGQFTKQYAKVSALSEERRAEIARSLHEKDGDPNATFDTDEQLVRDLFDAMHAYATATGLPVRQVRNYFPRQFDRERLLTDQDKIIKHIANEYGKRFPKASNIEAEEHAKNAFNSLISLEAQDGRATQDATETPGFRHMNSRISRTKWFDQYLDSNLDGVVSNYINSVVKRTEFNRLLGQRAPNVNKDMNDMIKDGDWDPKGRMHRILSDAKKQGASTDDLKKWNNTSTLT